MTSDENEGNTTMMTRDQFIDQEILPTLDQWADDFDIDGICDKVSEYDEREGYVWKAEYADDADAYWDTVKRYDKTAD